MLTLGRPGDRRPLKRADARRKTLMCHDFSAFAERLQVAGLVFPGDSG